MRPCDLILATESPNMGLKMDIQDKPVMKRFFNCGQGWIRTTAKNLSVYRYQHP